jgi:hypothetical protein
MALLPIEFHPEAVAEAHDACEWYAVRSEAAAERFMEFTSAFLDVLPQRAHLAIKIKRYSANNQ